MTTHAFRITLGDSEVIALKEAIERYMVVCKEELAAGPKSPYWAHLRSLEGILDRLYGDAEMTSTSSPCWPALPAIKGEDDQ